MAVEHTAKKQKSTQRATATEDAPAKGPSQQKSAQKASVAEQFPAKAPSQQAAPHIEKKAPGSQRRTTPRNKALGKTDKHRPGLCNYDSLLIAPWILCVFLLQSLCFWHPDLMLVCSCLWGTAASPTIAIATVFIQLEGFSDAVLGTSLVQDW